MHIRAEAADHLDILEFGAATADTRLALNVPHRGLPAATYAPGEYGLYAVQFHSGLKPLWLHDLEDIGAVYYNPLPVAGTMVGATPEMAQTLRRG